jgi:hypothetical protein
LIFNKREGVWYRSKVDFVSYGTKASKSEKSGAYIFLPDGPAKVNILLKFVNFAFCVSYVGNTTS